MPLGRAIIITSLAASFLAAIPADADGCEEYVPHVGMACVLPNGHYEVTLADGFQMVTHGPDPIPPAGDIGFDAGDEQRQPVCADAWRMHVLYGHPGNDRSGAVIDDLRDAIRRANAVLNADAIESGDVEADYKVACNDDGSIRIDVFEGPATGGNGAYTVDFNNIVEAARTAGFTDPQTDYLIFYDGNSEGVCGVGNLAKDDRLSEDNRNMQGPDYGVAYESCWFGRTPMHENGHNQGAVQDLAPDWDASGHCLEGYDVMCYPTQSFLVFCGDRTHFDCDHDTYFDADPEPGEWLDSHWNIGSRLTRYIAFGDMPAPVWSGHEPETNETPVANNTTPEEAPAKNATSPEEPPSPENETRPEPAPRQEAPVADARQEPQVIVIDARREQTTPGPALPLLLVGLAVLARR